MAEILVTGGTGDLGRELVPRLVSSGYGVRVLSRRESPSVPAGVRAVRGDLVTGVGLAEAVEGVDIIAHCATGSRDSGVRGLFYGRTKRTDVDPTQRLLDLAKQAGRPRVVYISIVGIDKIPLGYYRGKLDCERAIEASGLPYTILRATQFHGLGWELGQRLTVLPLVMLPKGVKSQLVDAGEVAERMVELIETNTLGLAPDMGGPEVLPMRDIVRGYLRATKKRRVILEVPVPGGAVRGFRAGLNLAPEHADGKITWEEWLKERAR